MRFDPNKAWPHPVLRPRFCGDDYPKAEFQVEISAERIKGSTAVVVQADYSLSDPDLLELVSSDRAQFILVTKAPQTHFRESIASSEPTIIRQFKHGEISGRVEFAPLLVCTQSIADFRANGWHSAFLGRSFHMAPGSVLAEDTPKEYWIDTADERPLGSIFGHKPVSDLPDGRWQLELREDRIWILMSDNDSARYESARNRANNQPEAQYLINGLYLPALVSALNEVDAISEDYQEYRWFSSLAHRLEATGCRPLGSPGADREIDAQKIFESPFLKMPMFAEVEG